MSSTQGVNQIPLPEELKKALEVAQNRVSILEAEAMRFTRLCKQQEASLNGTLADESRAKQAIVELKAEITALELEKNSALAANKGIMDAQSAINSELNGLKALLSEAQSNLDSLKQSYADTRADLDSVKADLMAKTVENDKQQAKLRPLIDSIVTLHNAL